MPPQVLSDFQDLLKNVSTGMIEQAQIEKGSRWIEALEDEYPLAHRLLMMTLYGEPREVMKTLCMIIPALREYRQNPHVLAYVGKLQNELRGKKKR